MRNLKKVLALVLAMAMSLSLAVTAGAAFNDQDKIVNEEAVDMCVALNIINGRTNGDFDPAGNVTRAEMAKMICIVLNGGKEPITATKAEPTFADIAGHWAEGYIEYCFAKGVIAGKSATEFDPNGSVTGTEAAKMLLVALGYNAEIEKMVGANWALYTNVLANQDGLYEDLEAMDPGAALSRDNAAQMIWNTLNSGIVQKTSSIENGSVRESYTKTSQKLITAKYDTTEVEGDLSAFSYNSDKEEWTYTIGYDYENAEGKTVKAPTFTTDEDFTDLYMQDVKVIFKGKDVYGIFACCADVVVSGVIGDIENQQPNADGEIEIADVDYKADASVAYYAFGEGAKAADCDAYAFDAIDNDDNGKIDRVVFYPFSVAEINYVGSKTFTTDPAVDGPYTIEDVNIYEGFAKEDNVVIFKAVNTADDTDTFVKADVISGEVTVQNGFDWTIGGEVYTATKVFADLKLGNEVDAVVVNGYIFAVEKTSSEFAMTDVVYVNGVATEEDKYDPSEKTTTIKAVFTDGTASEVVLNADDSVAVVKGGLYTFEIEDGEYVLSDFAADDFDAKKDVTKAGDDRIEDLRVNDDAVVFVKDAEGDVVVMTGADVKAWGKATPAVGTAYANETNGYNYVELAALTVTTEDAPGASADDVYGYIVAELGLTKEDSTTYASFTVWTGSANETIKVKASDVNGAEKGSFIKVDEDVITVLSNKVAIKGYDADSVEFYVGGEKKIVDETIIIYVDTDAVAGAEGGAITVATDHITSGTYELNAVYAEGDTAGELAVLFVDVNNELK